MLRRLVRGYYSLRYFPRRLFAALHHISGQLAALEQSRAQSAQQGSATLADIEGGISAFCDDATRAMLGLDRAITAASDRMSQVHRALIRAQAASHQGDGVLDEMRGTLDEVRAQTFAIRAALGRLAIGTPAAASLGALASLIASVGGADTVAPEDRAGTREGGTGYEGVRAAVSVGLANDMRWDAEMARRGIPVLQFDPTISGPPMTNPLFTFERLAVVGATASDGITLAALLQSRIAPGVAPLVLKLDMDSCDWSIIGASDRAVLQRFQLIVLQFRRLERLGDAAFQERLLGALARITETHLVEQARAYGCANLLGDTGAMTPSSVEIHCRSRTGLSVADAQTSAKTMIFSHLSDRRDGPGRVQEAVSLHDAVSAG